MPLKTKHDLYIYLPWSYLENICQVYHAFDNFLNLNIVQYIDTIVALKDTLNVPGLRSAFYMFETLDVQFSLRNASELAVFEL